MQLQMQYVSTLELTERGGRYSVRERQRREGRRRESSPSRSAGTSRGGPGRQTEEW